MSDPAPAPTSPYIYDAQNLPENRRLVAAFARMYTDAKILFAVRIFGVAALAVGLVVAGVLAPQARSIVSGLGSVVLLVASIVVTNVEKTHRTRAAATQEEFDTRVFRLTWNAIHVDRPSASHIQHAAARYEGTRDTNWYDPTSGTHRPFDVLICQAANFGWGTTMHRRWGWTLSAIAIVLLGVLASIASLVGTSYAEGLLVVVGPFVTVFKELIEQIKANFEASAAKEKGERQLADLWSKGMSGSHIPTELELRSLQDKILALRQSNPYVPDWFDERFRKQSEAAMRASTDDRVREAIAAGHAMPGTA
ncbi:MAG: hypothetical protein KAG80_07200 [Nocardioides sp.]|nr:hypothetical protein [Nocardioides sp.]